MHYICVKLIRSLCPAFSFFRTVIRNGRMKRQVKIVPSRAGDILSQRSLPFSRLSRTSPLSLSFSLSLSPTRSLSDSQWRCRRSSFGSTRLLANVPISEGRVRTTNHRCRGRGERLWPRGSLLRLRVLSQPPSCTGDNGNTRVFPPLKILFLVCLQNFKYREIFGSLNLLSLISEISKYLTVRRRINSLKF